MDRQKSCNISKENNSILGVQIGELREAAELRWDSASEPIREEIPVI